MRSLGIDVGSSSIKIAEVVSTSRGVQVLSFREFPLGINPAYDRDLEILEVLKGLALQYDPTQTRVVLGLRQDYVSLRYKTFPFNDRLKILKSLPFELEEDLPYSAETAIYDGRIVQTIGPMAEVLTATAPKNRIESALRAIRDSGVEPTLLTAEAMAFANCFERWQEPPKSSPTPPPHLSESLQIRRLTARILIGHTRTLVLAFEEDRLVGARSVLWGAKNVVDAIARRYELSAIEAEKEMRGKAFVLLNKNGASYDQILFSDTISQQVQDLGRELKISLLEFQTELGGEILGAEISGSFSQTLNIQALLTQILEMPVNRSHFLANFSTSFEKTPAVENSIGVALGLALEGLRKPRNPAIQFLRADFAKQSDGFKEVWENWGPTLKFGVASFILLMAYVNLRDSFSLSLLDNTTEALKVQGREVAGLTARNANETGIKTYIRNQKKRIQEAKALESVLEMNSALDIIRQVSDNTPGRGGITLQVTRFHIEDDKVNIQGSIGSAAQLKTLETAMKAVAKGAVRATAGAAVQGKNAINFTMSFEVDRNIVAAN